MSKSVLDTIREYKQDPQQRQDVETHELELALCDKMIEFRENAGLTQEALANTVGCTQGYIAKLENGAYDRCGIGTLRKFALALGYDINLNWLFRAVDAHPWMPNPVFFSNLPRSNSHEIIHQAPAFNPASWEDAAKAKPEMSSERELAA